MPLPAHPRAAPSPTSISDAPAAEHVRKRARPWAPHDPPAMALSPQHLNLSSVALPEKRPLHIAQHPQLAACVASSALAPPAAASADALLHMPKPKKRRNWAPIAVVPMVKINLPADVAPTALLELKLDYQTMCSWESQIFMVSTLLSLVKCVLRPHADLKKIAALGRRLSKTRKRFLNAQRAVFDVQNERNPPTRPAISCLVADDAPSQSKLSLRSSPAAPTGPLPAAHASIAASAPPLQSARLPWQSRNSADTESSAAPQPNKSASTESEETPTSTLQPRALDAVVLRGSLENEAQQHMSPPLHDLRPPVRTEPAAAQPSPDEKSLQHHKPSGNSSRAEKSPSTQQAAAEPQSTTKGRDSCAPIDTCEIASSYHAPAAGVSSAVLPNQAANDIVGSPIEQHQQQWLAGGTNLDGDASLPKLDGPSPELAPGYPPHEFSPVTPGNAHRRVVGVGGDAYAAASAMAAPTSTAWESTSYSSSVTHMNSQAAETPFNNILMSRLMAPSSSNLPFTPSTTINHLTNPLTPMSAALNNAPVTSFAAANIPSANHISVFDAGHTLLGRAASNAPAVLAQARDLMSLTLDKADLSTWDTPKDSYTSSPWSRSKDAPSLPPRTSYADNPTVAVHSTGANAATANLPPPANLGALALVSAAIPTAPPATASCAMAASLAMVQHNVSNNYSNDIVPSEMVSNNYVPTNLVHNALQSYAFEGATDPNTAAATAAYMDGRMSLYSQDLFGGTSGAGACGTSGPLNSSTPFFASAPNTSSQPRTGVAGERDGVASDGTSLLAPWPHAG